MIDEKKVKVCGFGLLAMLMVLSMYIIKPRAIVLYLCVGLLLLILLYGYLHILWPLQKWNRKLRTIVRNRAWDNVYERDLWPVNSLKEDMTEIIQGLIRQNIQQESAEIYEKQAQLLALQSQINPHFLYNTLDSIRGQALLKGEKDIAAMLEALANFFRYSISRKDSIVTWWEELKNLDNYIKIQNYRFKNRFVIEIDEAANNPEIQNCTVPKLLLQPIVENAVIHGLESRLNGKVLITLDYTEDILLITVSDDGKGMEPEVLERINQKLEGKLAEPRQTGHHGIALTNVNNRIKNLFGREFGICIYSTPDKGTDVEIMLPRKVKG